jgi:hypothetical protein
VPVGSCSFGRPMTDWDRGGRSTFPEHRIIMAHDVHAPLRLGNDLT